MEDLGPLGVSEIPSVREHQCVHSKQAERLLRPGVKPFINVITFSSGVHEFEIG